MNADPEHPGPPWDFMVEAFEPLEKQLVELGCVGIELSETIRDIGTHIYDELQQQNITAPSEQKAYIQAVVDSLMSIYEQNKEYLLRKH